MNCKRCHGSIFIIQMKQVKPFEPSIHQCFSSRFVIVLKQNNWDMNPQTVPKPIIFYVFLDMLVKLFCQSWIISWESAVCPTNSVAHYLTGVEGTSLQRYYRITACLYNLLTVNRLTVNFLAVHFLIIKANSKRIYCQKRGENLARFHA